MRRALRNVYVTYAQHHHLCARPLLHVCHAHAERTIKIATFWPRGPAYKCTGTRSNRFVSETTITFGRNLERAIHLKKKKKKHLFASAFVFLPTRITRVPVVAYRSTIPKVRLHCSSDASESYRMQVVQTVCRTRANGRHDRRKRSSLSSNGIRLCSTLCAEP
uniref:Uncharacterized protein n=1 Tax=Sipha flava TaxID=143950 RepID=A0A2S2QTW3_9HEMI